MGADDLVEEEEAPDPVEEVAEVLDQDDLLTTRQPQVGRATTKIKTRLNLHLSIQARQINRTQLMIQ